MIELWLLAPQHSVDTVSDALLELEALSVTVEDADADTPDEVALYGEPDQAPAAALTGWPRTVVRALFHEAAAATEAATVLLAQDWADGVHVQRLEPVPEQDWVRLTQAQFGPVAVTPRFWIVPSWHQAPPEAAQVLRLDPGMAFGTGAHPTTLMCLRWIAAQPRGHWGRVLDYGCGSGILAIAAALHGAGRVEAVDIDPAAVQATRDNAAINQVALQAGTPDLAQGRYDVVLANILATPLKLLAPLLCSRLAPGGRLVLAGLLERQAADLIAVYAPWLQLQATEHLDGWTLLSGAASPLPPDLGRMA